ncbi:MAG: hypothetical protein C7B45_04480 [Sulfobacillus acidophilus]|uniref:Glycosyl transferase family 1 domain-containing protein n=1 Tax=Sulfobacillus acidophilus TaxID=53633 RepID=A0A2T2WLC2_9FIRM|nr:MAG: hypothetical protein C7B45_04480 [Sulfobacillus acidophilus]
MSSSILWVVHDLGCNPGALAAYWGSEVLNHAGWRVVVQPLVPPTGRPLAVDWPHVNAPLSAHPQRWSKKAQKGLQDVACGFDRIICDQDFMTDWRVVEAATGHVGLYLLGRQTEPLTPLQRSLYTRLDGILTVSRVAHAHFAHANVVMASRLHCLPPLVDWQRKLDRLDGERNGLRIITAGIVDTCKGLDLVFNALSVLRDQGQLVTLTVLGDGPERNRLEVYARALGVSVQFVPQWSGWAAWLLQSDYLLAPQFDDGLALDVDAAVSLGVAVIGHKLPVIVERASLQPQALLLDEMNVMTVVNTLKRLRPGLRLHGTSTARIAPWEAALALRR